MSRLLPFPFLKNIFDRRCRFHDLRRITSGQRRPQSPIIQFYSSSNNIGNYLPVLGIQEMLSRKPDTWCIHDKDIDFDFINANYRCAIIGGAGLLHSCFNPFWKALSEKCRLPMIIWGVGGCFPDGDANAGVEKSIVTEVAQRCDLINLRDDLTANFYNLKTAQISACPTIVYLQKFKASDDKTKPVLFSSHESLVSHDETEKIHHALKQCAAGYKYTDNTQRRRLSLVDIIQNSYCETSLVVTTRLHGAIIAYGLGVPYIGIARDEKLRDFCRLYSNGVMLESIEELPESIRNTRANILGPIALEKVLEFGNRARNWLASLKV
jgi:hypothetical protein